MRFFLEFANLVILGLVPEIQSNGPNTLAMCLRAGVKWIPGINPGMTFDEAVRVSFRRSAREIV